jgi:hypothetical protein
MRYATWKVDFSDNEKEGTTPETQMLSLGLIAEGSYSIDNFTVAGYIEGEAELVGLEKWEVTEISSEEFLATARTQNSNASFTESGRLAMFDPQYMIF